MGGKKSLNWRRDLQSTQQMTCTPNLGVTPQNNDRKDRRASPEQAQAPETHLRAGGPRTATRLEARLAGRRRQARALPSGGACGADSSCAVQRQTVASGRVPSFEQAPRHSATFLTLACWTHNILQLES